MKHLEYIGVGIQAVQSDSIVIGEIARFEVCLLNTINNALFTIRLTCSSAAIEGPRKIAADYITTKSRTGIRRYCRKRGITIAMDELDAIGAQIYKDVQKCCQSWLDGKKNIIIRWTDKKD